MIIKSNRQTWSCISSPETFHSSYIHTDLQDLSAATRTSNREKCSFPLGQSQRKQASETFLLHHFLRTETAAVRDAASKWDTRVSCNVPSGGHGGSCRLEAAPLDPLTSPKITRRNSAFRVLRAANKLHRKPSPQDARRHERAAALHNICTPPSGSGNRLQPAAAAAAAGRSVVAGRPGEINPGSTSLLNPEHSHPCTSNHQSRRSCL